MKRTLTILLFIFIFFTDKTSFSQSLNKRVFKLQSNSYKKFHYKLNSNKKFYRHFVFLVDLVDGRSFNRRIFPLREADILTIRDRNNIYNKNLVLDCILFSRKSQRYKEFLKKSEEIFLKERSNKIKSLIREYLSKTIYKSVTERFFQNPNYYIIESSFEDNTKLFVKIKENAIMEEDIKNIMNNIYLYIPFIVGSKQWEKTIVIEKKIKDKNGNVKIKKEYYKEYYTKIFIKEYIFKIFIKDSNNIIITLYKEKKRTISDSYRVDYKNRSFYYYRYTFYKALRNFYYSYKEAEDPIFNLYYSGFKSQIIEKYDNKLGFAINKTFAKRTKIKQGDIIYILEKEKNKIRQSGWGVIYRKEDENIDPNFYLYKSMLVKGNADLYDEVKIKRQSLFREYMFMYAGITDIPASFIIDTTVENRLIDKIRTYQTAYALNFGLGFKTVGIQYLTAFYFHLSMIDLVYLPVLDGGHFSLNYHARDTVDGEIVSDSVYTLTGDIYGFFMANYGIGLEYRQFLRQGFYFSVGFYFIFSFLYNNVYNEYYVEDDTLNVEFYTSMFLGKRIDLGIKYLLNPNVMFDFSLSFFAYQKSFNSYFSVYKEVEYYDEEDTIKTKRIYLDENLDKRSTPIYFQNNRNLGFSIRVIYMPNI